MKKKEQFQLTNLVDHLSHELRTPLSAILGYTNLLDKSENLDELEKDHLKQISNSGKQLLDVINDIIEVSNLELGLLHKEQNTLSIHALAEELERKYSLVAEVEDLLFSVNIQHNTFENFKSDEKKIKTIINSLVNNAFKFTDTGEVTISLQLARSKEDNQPILKVEVTDTGIGMSENELKYIFKPFWRAQRNKSKGTGLGLTSCHKLIDILDGSICMDSEAGTGTKVELTIPVQPIHENAQVKEDLKDINFSAANLRALIVDDLPINRTLARLMLEMKDIDTHEAENGQQAIECFEEYNPDFILMDISMPVMDGIEAMEKIRSIREDGYDLPIIAITAGGHTGKRLELMERGFSEYIQKPFREDELFEKLSQMIPSLQKEKHSAA